MPGDRGNQTTTIKETNTMEKYQALKQRQREELNAFPIQFAFNQEQFAEGEEKHMDQTEPSPQEIAEAIGFSSPEEMAEHEQWLKEYKENNKVACLTVDGFDFLWGYRKSLRVIFNNLTGKNFTGPEYDEYMTMMEAELKISLKGKTFQYIEKGE